MLNNKIQYSCLFAVALMSASCDKAQELVDSLKEEASPISAQSKENTASKIEHSNAAVEALSTSMFGDVRYSYERYISWANPETGPTGKELIIGGVQAPTNMDAKVKEIDKVISLKAYPSLSEKAVGFKKAVEDLYPLMTEASQYYKRQDYKDDDMKKGRELHVKLMQGFSEYFTKKGELDAALSVIQDEVLITALKKAKAEGRHIEYEVKTVLMVSDRIWELSSQDDIKTVPLDEITKELEKLISSQEEIKTLSEGLGEDDKRVLMNYYITIDTLIASIKKFARSVRDIEKDAENKRTYVLNSPEDKRKDVLNSYNSLIHTYNSVIRSVAITK